MADNNNTTPVAQKVEITLPPGMTAEQYLKSFQTFKDSRERQNKIYKADWRAMSRVVKAHKEEYIIFRIEEWKALGLDTSKMSLK